MTDETFWPTFATITEPEVICFGVGNGSGSKLLQSYLDGHPEIYMTPFYQLMYLYPHWQQWQEELRENWTWSAIIDQLCYKHGSLIDSRRVSGHDGMTCLGENRDQYLAINEELFKGVLLKLLQDRPINSRDFILAIHYAYAFVRGEDLAQKKVLIYHLHVHEYVPKYMIHDFPMMRVICFVRDPRSNLKGRYQSEINIASGRLDATDAAIHYVRWFYFNWEFMHNSLECLRGIPLDRIRAVRHEDINCHLEELMHAIVNFLGIRFTDCLLRSTVGGLAWWGDKVYNMAPMNKPNPSVVSLKWQQQLACFDGFVIEGAFIDYCDHYRYERWYLSNWYFCKRFIYPLLAFFPMWYEWRLWGHCLYPKTLWHFLQASYREATGREQYKDTSFNAYYRHKWSNRGLKLWRKPWYKRLSIWVLDAKNSKPGLHISMIYFSICPHLYVFPIDPVFNATIQNVLLLDKEGNAHFSNLCENTFWKNVMPLSFIDKRFEHYKD